MTDTELAQRYGPWALIAGGSQGIGLCLAQQLAQAGINLLLIARRQAPLDEASRAITSRHPVEVRTCALDLCDNSLAGQLDAVVDGLEIGLMIYNAGAVHGAGLFLDEPLEKAQQLVKLNCQGPLLLCHRLGNAMRARGRGGIMLLSSLSGLTGGAYVATYAATKAFDIILAESLWAELRPHGVDVLGLIAGATDTPAMADSGVAFTDGQAMDPAEVAREGLLALPQGPIHVAGEGNRSAAEILRAGDRRQSVAMMSAGAAALYEKEMPTLPAAGD